MPVYFSLRNAEISKVRIYFEETKLSQKCCISCSLLYIYKKCSFSENVCCRSPCIWKYEHQWTEACSSLSCWPTLLPPRGLFIKGERPTFKKIPISWSIWRQLLEVLSQSCLAVRFPRYKIEKGLRAVITFLKHHSLIQSGPRVGMYSAASAAIKQVWQ